MNVFPALAHNRKTVWILVAVFAVAYGALVALYYQKTHAYAIQEAHKIALDALISHKAVHRYVAEIQRPEIYRLKDEGHLYKDYFSPKVMSFTYIARSVKELLNKEREKAGLPSIYFKLAADNPRNPLNQADEFELALLARMNKGEVHEIHEVIRQNGEAMLHMALPADRSGVACLKCHGDPQDAPAELIAQYGSERGFYERPDSIRALISIRIPLAGTLQAANQLAGMLSYITFLLLASLYGLVHIFVLRADRHQCAANAYADELRDAKDYAENLIHTANVMMVELDLAGHVKVLNPAAERITGYSQAELAGRNWFDTVVPKERYPAVWEIFQRAATRGIPSHFENPILTKAGEEHYIIWQNSELKTGGQLSGLLSFGIDMTENRKINQTLSEQDLMLHSAQYIAHIGTWRLTHADQSLTWSDEMVNIFEPPAEARAITLDNQLQAIHPEDRDRVKQALHYSIKQRGQYEMNYRLLLADGTEKHVHEHCETKDDGHGNPLVTIGVVQDVTMQALQELSVRASEERFRTIADFTFDWEYWQGAQGEMLYINPACERVTGYAQAEFIAHPALIDEIVHPEDREAFSSHHLSVSSNEVASIEFRIVTRDGQERWIGHSCRGVFDANGRPAGRRISNRDITERKQAEAELLRHRQHLEEMVLSRTAELMNAKIAAEASSRAKTAFLANMSHELRTPMTGVLGMIDLAKRRMSDPKGLDQLDKAKLSADRLLGVLNDILDISKIEADRMVLEDQPLQIAESIANLTGTLGHKASEKGLRLAVDIPAELAQAPLNGDPLRLGQVLFNLVGNAIKFTEHGEVVVQVRQLDETADALQVRFAVTDTGIGIAPEALARLFQSFEQADNSMTRKYGGTGLGLAISKRLVQLMGGEIGVESAPGTGSTFWFDIPLKKREPGAVTPAPGFAALAAEQRLHSEFAGSCVLLAEDEPVSQEVSRGLLADVGLLVDLAENGQQALQLARQNHYALILMDMQMPVMNGVEATQAIRADSLNLTTPILAMTANAFDEDKTVCLDAGMNDHISKPVEPQRLYDTLLTWLQKQT